jgi:hypothetical protein
MPALAPPVQLFFVELRSPDMPALRAIEADSGPMRRYINRARHVRAFCVALQWDFG